MSSPCTTAMRGDGSPASSAKRCSSRAAAGGLAAPKLPTMGMPAAKQDGSTGPTSSASSGSYPAPGSARRATWPRARVRSASVSNMTAPGRPERAMASTTGPGASVRSPENPAPQPIRKGPSMPMLTPSQPLNAACASGSAQILLIAAAPAAVIAASSPPA